MRRWAEPGAGAAQEGEIYEIYLRPEYQGIGLGRVLFGEAKSLLKSLGCEGLVVWCLEDSANACNFFHSAGGRDIAEGMEDFGEKHLKKVGFVWSLRSAARRCHRSGRLG